MSSPLAAGLAISLLLREEVAAEYGEVAEGAAESSKAPMPPHQIPTLSWLERAEPGLLCDQAIRLQVATAACSDPQQSVGATARAMDTAAAQPEMAAAAAQAAVVLGEASAVIG